jgi:uncharacterized protein with HEPN domain
VSDKNRIILEKILSEAKMVDELLHGLDEPAFLADETKKRAVCMTLLNIGELVKNLDSGFRLQYENVPWKAIAGFRDVVAHGYFTVNMGRVWLYAANDLPTLSQQILKIMQTE